MSAKRGRAPWLSASMLGRIRARCVTRARRYRRNHPGFSSREEMYFFFGAMAALGCFPDPAAKTLANEWMRDLFGHRSPCDQSPATQAARVSAAARAAERDATLAAFFASVAGAGKGKIS